MLPIVLGALKHAQEHGGLCWYGLGMLAVCMSPTMAVHYRACGLDLRTTLVFDNAPPLALKPLVSTFDTPARQNTPSADIQFVHDIARRACRNF